ncbi:DEAD/DEAH box helicase [Actinophytocola glycyrrhizae]|uniref:Helicase associated domain protein n=1 Tax=Actinophytocola glycyrrhizae TaxID=2044873 RepID=A0ABV9SCZ6_9PSEU
MTPVNHVEASAVSQEQQLTAVPVKTSSADRYYQTDAVNAVHKGYTTVDRGQLHMACGTGKTRVYMRVAVRECAGGLVVVLAPSVWLLGQIIKDWRADFGLEHVAMAVCHDLTVADDPAGYGIAVPVTTSQREVAKWLTGNRSAAVTRLVVATHRSARVVGQALYRAGLAADLLIVDEAHHSAGRADKMVAFVHDNVLFPAARRLYGTATPVQLAESGRRAVTVHMDDEASFGPVFYTYPLARAIADTYLDDYRLVVVGVSDGEARRLLERRRATPAGKGSLIDLHTAMCQIVLAKTAERFDLRRVIVFDRSVDDAIHFAETLPATVEMMAEDRPDRPLTSSFVYGEMKIRERNRELDLLREPPGDGWVSLSNMRCLGEGIDVPAVDGVMFTYPKQSPVEIVQAVGRATRRNPSGSGISTIILPIAVPDAADHDVDQDSLTVGRYRVLWDVLRGLRQHDAMLSREIDHLSTGGSGNTGVAHPPGGKIEIYLPKGWKPMEFLQQLAVRVVATTRSVWWDGMEALRQFHAEHGHTDVVAGTIVNEVDLSQWSATARDTYRRGRMPEDRDAALRAVGFDPEGDAVSWTKGFHASCAFRDRYGHLEAPEGLVIDGVHVQAWQEQQRDLHAEGVLSSLRWRRLEAIGMRWTSRPRTTREYLDAVAAYHQQHGHIDIDADAVSDDGYLGQWLVEQRLAWRKGVLEDEVRQRLDEMGMDWNRAPKPVRRFAAQEAQ